MKLFATKSRSVVAHYFLPRNFSRIALSVWLPGIGCDRLVIYFICFVSFISSFDNCSRSEIDNVSETFRNDAWKIFI